MPESHLPAAPQNQYAATAWAWTLCDGGQRVARVPCATPRRGRRARPTATSAAWLLRTEYAFREHALRLRLSEQELRRRRRRGRAQATSQLEMHARSGRRARPRDAARPSLAGLGRAAPGPGGKRRRRPRRPRRRRRGGAPGGRTCKESNFGRPTPSTPPRDCIDSTHRDERRGARH